MAVFGAPVAHEDDAERAVRAALSMQRAVRRVLDDERGGGAPLGLRVGLNTGEVVAGVQAAHRIHGHRRHGEHRRPAGRRGRGRRRLRRRAHRRRPPGRSPPGGRCARCGSRASASRSRRTSCSACSTRRAPGPASATRRRSSAGRPRSAGWPAGSPRSIDRGEPRVLVLTAEAGLGKTRFAAEVERLRRRLRRRRRPVRRRAPAPGCSRCTAPRSASGAGSRPWPTWSAPRSACPTDAATAVDPAGGRGAAAPARPAAGPAAAGDPPPVAVDLLLALLGYAEPLPAGGGAGRGRAWPTGRDRRRRGGARRGRRAALRAGRRGAAGGDRGRPARRHAGDGRRARRDAVPARPGRSWCCCWAGPSWSAPPGALTRLADAEVHALPPLRGADAARLLTVYLRRRPAAAGRRGPAAGHRPGQPVLPGRAGHAADGARRADHGAGRRRGRHLAAGARLAGRPAALPGPGRRAGRPHRRAAGRRPRGAAGRRGGRRHRARPGALEALREQRAGPDGRPGRGGRASSSSGPSRSCCSAACCTAPGAGTPSRRRCCARPRTPGSARPTWPSGTPTWRAGPRPSDPAGPRPPPGGLTDADRATRSSPSTPSGPSSWPTRWGCGRTRRPGRSPPLGRGRARPAGPPGAGTPVSRRQAVEYAERAAALAGGRAAAGRPAGPRPRAAAGWAGPATRWRYAEKIAANAGDDAASRAERAAAGRAGPTQALGDAAPGGRRAGRRRWQVATDGRAADRARPRRCAGSAWPTSWPAGWARRAAGSPRRTRSALAAGDRRGQAWSLQNLAWVTTTRGDFAGTDAVLGRAARLFAELRRPGRPGLAARHHRVRPAAGRAAARGPPAGPGLPAVRRAGRRGVGGRHAAGGRGVRRPPSWANWPRPTGRPGGRTGTSPRSPTTGGAGFALVVRGVVARGLGEPEHALDLLTDALEYADRTGHPLLTRDGRHASAASSRSSCGDCDGRRGGRPRGAGRGRAAQRAGAGPGRPAGAAGRRPGSAAGDAATAVGLLAPVATRRRRAGAAVLAAAGAGPVRVRAARRRPASSRRWTGPGGPSTRRPRTCAAG